MKFEDLIGNTPMYQAGEGLFLKLEYTNPTGSVKDRAAWEMVAQGERQGTLTPGATIVEPTSGNMGISLAAIAANRGYGCLIVMPDTMSLERQQLIRAYGGEVLLTPGVQGMAGAAAEAKRQVALRNGAWMPGQFDNPANLWAHYRTTGPEIWVQMEGRVDIFLAGVGTGGTLTGAGRYLKQKNPAVQVMAVEPATSPLLSQGRAGSHKIQGIGANFVPGVLDVALIDRVVTVGDRQAFAAMGELAGQGILAGISSGAVYWAAQRLAAENPGKNVVTILPDSGNRYLSIL